MSYMQEIPTFKEQNYGVGLYVREAYIRVCTFIRMTLFNLTPAGFCKSHMKRIRRVFPQPVSPMMITGMPHLQAINNL